MECCDSDDIDCSEKKTCTETTDDNVIVDGDTPIEESVQEENKSNHSNNNVTKPLFIDNIADSSMSTDNIQQRQTDMQKLKENCNAKDLELLKSKCELLIRDCIAGLHIQLSDNDFKMMEGQLANAETAFYRIF